MTQANNVAIESSQINSSGVLTVPGGGTGLSTVGTSGYFLQSNGTGLQYAAVSASGITGTLGVPNGGTGLTSLTAGYIPFGAGTSAFGSSSNLFWDNTNTRLGVGTNSPTYNLQIAGNVFSNQSVRSGNNIIITSTDLNSLINAGSYTGYSLTNAPSAGGGAWIFVEVFTNGSDQVFQRATPAQYQSNSVWNRMSTNGGTSWGSWLKESGTGGILQVQSSTLTTTFSASTPNWVTVTGLTVSITPSSTSSKILVMASVQYTTNGGGASAGWRLARNGTAICVATGADQRPAFSSGNVDGIVNTSEIFSSSNNYLDSPATTSAITYSVQVFSSYGSNVVYVNYSSADRDTTQYDARTASTITVMEIAG